MTVTVQNPRLVDPEMLQQLDPVERIIAQAFLNEGRWQVKKDLEGDTE